MSTLNDVCDFLARQELTGSELLNDWLSLMVEDLCDNQSLLHKKMII